jgi:hypothetical protein
LFSFLMKLFSLKYNSDQMGFLFIKIIVNLFIYLEIRCTNTFRFEMYHRSSINKNQRKKLNLYKTFETYIKHNNFYGLEGKILLKNYKIFKRCFNNWTKIKFHDIRTTRTLQIFWLIFWFMWSAHFFIILSRQSSFG